MLSQRDLAAEAGDLGRADLPFQLLNLRADVGLGIAEDFRRLREVFYRNDLKKGI